MQNFMDNMRPQQTESADGAAWYMKYATKAAGAVGGGGQKMLHFLHDSVLSHHEMLLAG